MLKHISILFLFCCYFACTGAQEAVAVRHYVFDHFSKGTVWQKNGRIDQAMLNYNILRREIAFESSPGQFMALASPEKVDTVFIEGRKFIPVNNECYELLTSGPYFLMLQYECSIKEPGVRQKAAADGVRQKKNTSFSKKQDIIALVQQL